MDPKEKTERIRVKEPMGNILDEHRIRRRMHEPSARQGREVRREDDDFAKFVLSHKDEVIRIMCNSQEFKDFPVCARVYR